MKKHNDGQPEFDFKAVFDPKDYLYFYGGLTEEKSRGEVEFLTKELALTRPMRILDLACGHGRHSNLLAEQGHEVTGVDITPGFLALARKEARRKGVEVNYLRGDMRKIAFRNEFDRVLVLFTAFGYFDDETNFKVLRNIARALKPGGRFVFDTINRDCLLKNFRSCNVEQKGDDLMIGRVSFDSITGRLYNKRIIIRDGKRKDAPFFVRLYTVPEIKELLAKVGLKLDKLYGNWQSAPLTMDTFRMIVIARKK
ncbi:MAG: methyltransferase domain-containing protein [Candidatus Brocadiia bacterium]